MENKKTAVEWLKEKLESDYGDPQCCELSWEELDRLFEQAKAMEKEQIIAAYDAGELNIEGGYIIFSDGREDYYNETYGK